MSMRSFAVSWTGGRERGEWKHQVWSLGVNGIAVDYGHDFDTTTKASIVYFIRHLILHLLNFLLRALCECRR